MVRIMYLKTLPWALDNTSVIKVKALKLHLSCPLCTYHCHAPPTLGRARMGLLGICKSRLTNSLPLGTILCCKSPTFCIGIPKTMKILGQMLKHWGTNCDPICENPA